MGLLVEELNAVRAKWYSVGLQLGVDANTLKGIEEDYNNKSAKCLQQTLMTWLKTYLPSHTWRNVVDALKSNAVGESRLAADLEHKYCSSISVSPMCPTTTTSSPPHTLAHTGPGMLLVTIRLAGTI